MHSGNFSSSGVFLVNRTAMGGIRGAYLYKGGIAAVYRINSGGNRAYWYKGGKGGLPDK